MTFSERMGLKLPKTVIQKDSMDSDLRNGLWNLLHQATVPGSIMAGFLKDGSPLDVITRHLWMNLWKMPVDQLSDLVSKTVDLFRRKFFSLEWYEVYDCIESVAAVLRSPTFTSDCNGVLERELSGYRLVGNRVVPITNDQELALIEQGLKAANPLGGINVHLETALQFLSDRKAPDYRNSVKEAISAVEALATVVTGDSKADLAKGLAVLEQRGALHRALKTAYLSLYSYTNDGNGIRHALMDDPNLTFADTKFMYLSCVNFITFMITKCAELGIDLNVQSTPRKPKR